MPCNRIPKGIGGYYIIEEGHVFEFECVVAIRLKESSIKQHHSDLVKEGTRFILSAMPL